MHATCTNRCPTHKDTKPSTGESFYCHPVTIVAAVCGVSHTRSFYWVASHKIVSLTSIRQAGGGARSGRGSGRACARVGRDASAIATQPGKPTRAETHEGCTATAQAARHTATGSALESAEASEPRAATSRDGDRKRKSRPYPSNPICGPRYILEYIRCIVSAIAQRTIHCHTAPGSNATPDYSSYCSS